MFHQANKGSGEVLRYFSAMLLPTMIVLREEHWELIQGDYWMTGSILIPIQAIAFFADLWF